jgi:hypothetical protein
MPKVNLVHNTKLSKSEIKEKAPGLIEGALEQHADKISDVHWEWNGDVLNFSLKVMGFPVSGEAAVYDGSIVARLKIPLVASPFKGKIEKGFREKAKELFP